METEWRSNVQQIDVSVLQQRFRERDEINGFFQICQLMVLSFNVHWWYRMLHYVHNNFSRSHRLVQEREDSEAWELLRNYHPDAGTPEKVRTHLWSRADRLEV
jgi:hypothetical protein